MKTVTPAYPARAHAGRIRTDRPTAWSEWTSPPFPRTRKCGASGASWKTV